MPSRNEAITVNEVKCQDITEVLSMLMKHIINMCYEMRHRLNGFDLIFSPTLNF